MPHEIFPKWPAELLAKAIIKIGAENSVAVANGVSERHYVHTRYILRVLGASIGLRQYVRELAIANIAQNSQLEGQKQLVCILTAFELLSSEKQVQFIRALTAAGTLPLGGKMLAIDRTYQGGYVPPRYEP